MRILLTTIFILVGCGGANSSVRTTMPDCSEVELELHKNQVALEDVKRRQRNMAESNGIDLEKAIDNKRKIEKLNLEIEINKKQLEDCSNKGLSKDN